MSFGKMLKKVVATVVRMIADIVLRLEFTKDDGAEFRERRKERDERTKVSKKAAKEKQSEADGKGHIRLQPVNGKFISN